MISLQLQSKAGVKYQVLCTRITPERILQHYEPEQQTWWCTHDHQCANFNNRPCCPPKTPLFGNMPRKNCFYIICVIAHSKDYFPVYPKVDASKSRMYFMRTGLHYLTRNALNKLSRSLSISYPQGKYFRVGGCAGCQYAKTKKCKNPSYQLEATGVNVCSLTEDVFKIPIQWPPQDYMVATGGYYTDQKITPRQIKEEIWLQLKN